MRFVRLFALFSSYRYQRLLTCEGVAVEAQVGEALKAETRGDRGGEAVLDLDHPRRDLEEEVLDRVREVVVELLDERLARGGHVCWIELLHLENCTIRCRPFEGVANLNL